MRQGPARAPSCLSGGRGARFTVSGAPPILGPVDLRQLEIFVKVAELGSFSRAAEALFMTQPTVSEHIRTLEDELGVRLLDRPGGVPTSRAPVSSAPPTKVTRSFYLATHKERSRSPLAEAFRVFVEAEAV